MESSPTMDKVRTHKIYTNPVGDWRTTPQAHDAPIWRKSNPVGGHSICPRLDVKILFLLFYQIPCPLFLCERRRKEKAIKKKRQRGDAQEGTFYKKSPLDSLKNFYTAHAELSACVPN